MVQDLERSLREELVKCMKILHSKGLISGLGGNASARLSREGVILITPSGKFKGDLTPDDICKIDIEGRVLEGCIRPSIESPLHTAIYKSNPHVNAIIHSHSPFTTGLALAGKKIEPVNYEAAVIFKEVPILEFRTPGSKELGELVAQNIKNRRAVILQNHGVVAVGSTPLEALSIIESLEEVSIMIFVASHFGEVKLIPKDRI
ncbi:MAG: class II aldolase/adducin family protein [Candidatus Methanomethylicaceae archaeon]|nr:class II aldolase/adducin family protein [Candidatus Verstraetearchaeota archaeon]